MRGALMLRLCAIVVSPSKNGFPVRNVPLPGLVKRATLGLGETPMAMADQDLPPGWDLGFKPGEP
jgi:hypothetical protein